MPTILRITIRFTHTGGFAKINLVRLYNIDLLWLLRMTEYIKAAANFKLVFWTKFYMQK